MYIGIDLVSIVLMESFGVLSFVVALIFFRQLQRMRCKQKAFLDSLNKGVISDRADGKCYSFEWVMDNIVHKPRKILQATPLLVVIWTFLLSLFYYRVGPEIFGGIVGLGYFSIITILATAALLWTDVFEAYSYATSIKEVQPPQLDKEDQIYMELAREGLEKAVVRFIGLGIAFIFIGPFVPSVFNLAPYVVASYSSVYFAVFEVLLRSLAFLGVFIVVIMPMLMLIFPALIGRIMIQKIRPIAMRFLVLKKS